MIAGVSSLVSSAAVMAIFLCAAPARAQVEVEAGTTHLRDLPSNVDLLLGTQAILHAVDMFSTAYDLQLSREIRGRAREGNPLLAPFSGRPVALSLATGAIDVLQVYTLTKLQRRHPKIALAWALILVGTEFYAVTNNVNVAGQLQRERAGRRRF